MSIGCVNCGAITQVAYCASLRGLACRKCHGDPVRFDELVRIAQEQGQGKEQETLPPGRKLIGTCRDCRWWSPLGAERIGHCGSEEARKDVTDTPHADFGCVHWEGKE